MYSTTQYVWAWLWYLLSVAVICSAWWYATRCISSADLRQVLRIIAPTMLLVPWFTGQGSSYLAPAWLMAAFELIFQGPQAFWRAGAPLLITLLVVLVLAIAIRLATGMRPQ